jgi:hypothetical protein
MSCEDNRFLTVQIIDMLMQNQFYCSFQKTFMNNLFNVNGQNLESKFIRWNYFINNLNLLSISNWDSSTLPIFAGFHSVPTKIKE